MKRAKASPKSPSKQARISSFFPSPSSSKQEGHFGATVVSSPSENNELAGKEALKQELTDEELARRLQYEWANEQDSPIASTSAIQLGSDDEQQMQPIKEEEEEESKALIAVEERPSTSTLFNFNNHQNGTRIDLNLEQLDDSIACIDLGTDIFLFDPEQVNVEFWPTKIVSGKEAAPSTPYALLAHAFSLLSSTRSRLAIVTILTNLLRVLMRHDSEALLPTIYLVSNHIAPPYDGVELGLGGSIVNRAIRDVTGKSATHLKSLWNKTGDPGDVAYEAKKDVKMLMGSKKPIEVVKLFSTLHQIANISGSGSSAAKLSHITKLLVACRGEETRFLVRTFHSHLRINAVRTTITSAIARAFSLDGPGQDEKWIIGKKERKGLLAISTKSKERNDSRRLLLMDKLIHCERLVRQVRARHPNFDNIITALVEGGLQELSDRVPLRVGTPLSPMLGSITRSLAAMHTKLGNRAFVSEFKYDGQRVQIHALHLPRHTVNFGEVKKALRGGKGQWVGPQSDVYVRLFSRHLEDMTDKYPDINNMIPILMNVHQQDEDINLSDSEEIKRVNSFIMDAEVVALSLDGQLLPFQTLANRSRKDVELNQVKVRVGVFAFDLMYLNGKSLLKTAFRKRRSLLHQMLPPCEPQDARIARYNHVKSLESNQVDDVEEFFRQARLNKCEG